LLRLADGNGLYNPRREAVEDADETTSGLVQDIGVLAVWLKLA
jgi:hypothetical protein